MRNSSSGEIATAEGGVVTRSSSSSAVAATPAASSSSSKKESKEEKAKQAAAAAATEDENSKKKPLLSKSAVCRLLAELVKSYGGCAKLITDHVYDAGISELIKEDTTALAFLLDELLISKIDKEIANLIKTLIAAIASCNQHADAQTTLVSEVKSALGRALAWPESNVKHSKIQALTTLVSTMIESCPGSHTQGALAAYKQQQYQMNNMVKIMLKRGIIQDLARVPHSLDLSSPNVAATVNAALKPLEILTR